MKKKLKNENILIKEYKIPKGYYAYYSSIQVDNKKQVIKIIYREIK